MPRLIAFAAVFFVLACSQENPTAATKTAPASPAANLSCEGTFDIELVYLPGERVIGEVEKMLIELAVSRWEAVITGDLPDMSFVSDPVNDYSPLLKTRVPISGWVDDIRIYIRVTDLPGTTGGSAWPTWVRRSTQLPIVAELAIDPSELEDELVNNGGFYKLVLHEIGHCLGFGTVWDNLNLVKRPSDPYFDGQSALTSYLGLLGWPDDYTNIRVPLQADQAHWRRDVFGDELMVSGWIYPNDKMLSSVTLSSMSDIGYEVNFWAGDDLYALPSVKNAKALSEDAREPSCHIQRRPIQSR